MPWSSGDSGAHGGPASREAGPRGGAGFDTPLGSRYDGAMAIAARKLTYADYAKIPPDHHRHEIIGGEEFMTPAPIPDHQTVIVNLAALLKRYVAKARLGRVFVAPIDVILSRHDIVQPDVLFISATRASIVRRKYLRGAPDLAIEVISPSTASIDRGVKRALYVRGGVREYWIVDLPERSIEIHEFGSPRRVRIFQEGQSFESALLPGLRIRVDDLFQA